MDQFKQQAVFPDAVDISTIDGMRVTWDKGWGLVRPSNTTPSLVLRFEAEDQVSLDEIQAKFRMQMSKINPQLKLPF